MIAFRVEDMSCGHCGSTISKAVQSADEGAAVEVDLDSHLVRIDPANADAETLATAIRNAGYTPVAVGGDPSGR